MKITKIGHCCMLVEEAGKRVLTDPGGFTVDAHAHLRGIDIVLFTHEHWDHFHLDSLRHILAANPAAKVIANTSVGKLLESAGVTHTVMQDGASTREGSLDIAGFGSAHEPIHSSLPPMYNTGYMIGGRFWYPGDAFTIPTAAVEIAALPVAGPWMRLGQAIDYALALRPKLCIPVHDMILDISVRRPGSFLDIPATVLEPLGIKYVPLEIAREYEF
ncbi:MAG TPA: MBL fold metallo-hydrolase [Candidatus Paceibacterota bacterium]